MMNIKKLAVAATAATMTASLVAAVPEVTGVTMTQGSDRTVTITYTLSTAPAVVTLDVQTNADTNATASDPGWTTIGGDAVWNAQGDVWKRVETGSRTITWRPDLSWPDHKIAGNGARAVVTAWSLDNTPNYMVVHLDVPGAAPNYYPAADYLPKSSYEQAGGAVTNNAAYKKTKLLMRKIMAKDITWTMGSTDSETQRESAKEAPHQVTLTNNYYIGVFPVTQYQWKLVKPTTADIQTVFTAEVDMRPIEGISLVPIRNNGDYVNPSPTANYYPNPPHESSFLGLLRNKTGIDFELPSEAQWEFAARAGNGDGCWGDGSAIKNTDEDENLSWLARYAGTTSAASLVRPLVNQSEFKATPPAEGGTPIVGSYAPNSWGIYDMHGTVLEFCLDWYEANISSYNGRVNVNPSSPAYNLGGTSDGKRVVKGGSWRTPASDCRPAKRGWLNDTSRRVDYGDVGFRVVSTAGLK